MSDNTKLITSKRCRGVIIPQYKKNKETRLNPLWGPCYDCRKNFFLSGLVFYGNMPDKCLITCKNPLSNKKEDEFETIYVSVEINSVCADCKKIECKDSDEIR